MKSIFSCLVFICLSVILQAQPDNNSYAIASNIYHGISSDPEAYIRSAVFLDLFLTACQNDKVNAGSSVTSDLANVSFDKIDLPNTTGRHSSLTVGPDGKLYALTLNGVIERFPINIDGTLATPDTLYSLQDEYGHRKACLAVGFAFDPSATATDLVAWVTHSSYVFSNGPNWDGKLTKLSGDKLQNVQDVLINLPRSAKDHVTNSIAFGPDGALYFNQGSVSTMGGADETWDSREECMLSAAVLRLDILKCGTFPLDVKTPDGGGTYNPYAVDAPLTIYASGIRNAYDLVWHSNGNLYVPTNGSSEGGNTPASLSGTLRTDGTIYNGPSIPELNDVQQTQKDFLFRIVKGGYYGHPNPARGEYVLNGGNPTSSKDSAQVDAYPVGTLPDINWRGYSFDFQYHKSPDGAIEYKSDKFNNALKGKLLVVRYSDGDDILVLTPGGPKNDIIASTEGSSIEGFSGFNSPLDLTEDQRTGNIYVSEYGGKGRIELLRPKNSLDSINAEKQKIFPNPMHKRLTIEFHAQYQGNYTMQIIDVVGRTYDIGKRIILPGITNVEVDISRLLLNSGIYFLSIRSVKGKENIYKLVVD